MRVNLAVGDVLRLKKSHPCGGDRFLVLRVGMDIRLRCERCGHEMLLPRAKVLKATVAIDN
jgi:hypothetical protein